MVPYELMLVAVRHFVLTAFSGRARFYAYVRKDRSLPSRLHLGRDEREGAEFIRAVAEFVSLQSHGARGDEKRHIGQAGEPR